MALINFVHDDIRDCKSIFDLAQLLDLDVKTLLFFAYKNSDLYKHYKIKKKSGGQRNISAPVDALKTTCRKLATHFNNVYHENLSSSVHGFVLERSIVTNAKKHLSKKYILNIDLENFFETINTGRVMGLLKAHPFYFNKQLASVVAGIVTHNNCLPQGSPASPIISNMICRKLDTELVKLAVSNNWVYSRYADDITISANLLNEKLFVETKEEFSPGKEIQKILSENGFLINKKKIRLAGPNQSKWVTGVKVNNGLNISRKYVRQVRTMLFLLEKQKKISDVLESRENQNLLNIIRGKISHIGHVKSKDNLIYIRLYNRLCDLENKIYKRIPESAKEKYKENVLVIKTSIGFGSGFFIGKNIIVTAAHVVGADKVVEITTRRMRLPVEFKGANVIYVDEQKDLAILYTISSAFSGAIFEIDFSNKNYNYDKGYVSVGYGGFRSNETYWSDVAVVDQTIVQIENKSDGNIDYFVNNSMWSGMSGGPVIFQNTGQVVGYIVNGSSTLATGTDVKSHIFRPIGNIPQEFRPVRGQTAAHFFIP